jgi:hypothetical protein
LAPFAEPSARASPGPSAERYPMRCHTDTG